MYAKTVLFMALAGSAAAIDIIPEHIRRDVLARRTDAPADPCLNALATVYSNAPTPPPKIVSYQMTAAPQTNPCSVTMPADLSAEYSSYTSKVLSWADANAASIRSAMSLCSTLTDLTTEIPVCTATIIAEASGSSSPKATESGDSPKATDGGDSPIATGKAASGNSTGTGAGSKTTGPRISPSQISPNAGPRETGMVAAAAVVAGFIGVVAFL